MYPILLVLWGLVPLAEDLPQCRCEASAACVGDDCRDLDLGELQGLVDTLPALEMARALKEAADARARGAGRLPNPELFGEFEDLGLSNPAFSRSQTTLGLTQAVPLGGRRGAQRRAAGLDARRAGLDLAATRRAVTAQVAGLFFEALAGRQKLELLEAAQQEALGELAKLRQREGLGEGASHETLAWEAELSATCGGLLEECARYQNRLLALASLMGLEDWRSLHLRGTLQGPEGRAERALPDSQSWPQLEAAGLGLQQARANLEHQRSLAVPDLDLGAGLRGLEGFDGQTLVFSLALPLPVFDRNQAGIGEAAAELRRAEALKRQVAREGSLQVRQLTQQREALRAQLARLETWTLPTLQRLVQALSLRQVGAGGELAALLAARERLLQARLQQLELETNLTQGDLELNLLTGAEVSHE